MQYTTSNDAEGSGTSVSEPCTTLSPRSRAGRNMPRDRSRPTAERATIAASRSSRPVPQPASKTSLPAPYLRTSSSSSSSISLW